MTNERQADARVIAESVALIREVAKLVVGKLDSDLHHRAYRAVERAMRTLADAESEKGGTRIVEVTDVRRGTKDDR